MTSEEVALNILFFSTILLVGIQIVQSNTV